MPNVSPDTETQVGGFFRCPITADHSEAVIRIGRRRLPAQVAEQSIDGFTVTVSPKWTSKLQVGRPWVLEYDGTRNEVHPQWMFNAPSGDVQLGLRRLRELTHPKRGKKKRSGLGRSGLGRSGLGGNARAQHDDPSRVAVIYGGFVLAVFAMLSLPGLGESLGTSQRIQGAFRWIVMELNYSFGRYL